MNKEDLKTGMVVENRECRKFMVIKNAINSNGCVDVLANEDTFYDLDNLADDLSCTGLRGLDIIKVYTSKTGNPIFSMKKNKLDIIWQRKEKPQLIEREKAYLKAYSYDYEWVARDENNKLFMYTAKPDKKIDKWTCFGAWYKEIELISLDFIKWEDEEPYNIKELLGE